MKHVKFGVFFIGLALAVGGVVSVISAQNQPSTRERRLSPEVLAFSTGGSQLGARVSDVEATSTTGGVRVDDVREDSPAARAGLQEGDVVVEYDGERVRSARQFTRLVQETPEGRAVKMAVMRNGQRQTLEAIPEERSMARGFSREPGAGSWEPEFFLRQLPHFNFDFDDRGPRAFTYRLPGSGSRLPSRGRLGVGIQSLTPDLEEYFGAKDGGVLVSSVAAESAAAKAGIRAGDVITSFNGERVADTGDLMRLLEHANGDVTIVVLRDKAEMTLKATVGTP